MANENFDPFDPSTLEEVDVEDTLSEEEAVELITQGEDHLGFESEEIDEVEAEQVLPDSEEDTEEEEKEETEEQKRIRELQEEMERMRNGFVGDLQDKRNQIRQLQELIDQKLSKIVQEQEAEATPEIDPNENPVEYLKSHFDTQLSEIRGKFEQSEAESFASQALQAATRAEQEFVKDHPDYYDKLKEVRASMLNNAVNNGYTKEQAISLMQQWEGKLIGQAYHSGNSPAEYIYNLAEQMGVASTPVEGTKEAEVASTNKPTVESDKIKRARAGSKNKTLSNNSGSGSSTDLDLKAVMELPDKIKNKVLLDDDLSNRLFSGGRISKMELPK